MFESIHDLLRFLVNNVRGQAAEADVRSALEFIDAHEAGTDGSIGDRPVPALTPAEEEQLAALQAKQDAKAADTARRAAGGTQLLGTDGQPASTVHVGPTSAGAAASPGAPGRGPAGL
jgi:hypothetical protein